MAYSTHTTTVISGHLPGYEAMIAALVGLTDMDERYKVIENARRFCRSTVRRGAWSDAACERLARKMGLVGTVEITTTVHNLSKGGVIKETRRTIHVGLKDAKEE